MGAQAKESGPVNRAAATQIDQTAKTRSRISSGPPECLRTGQRTIAALARDDSGAAGQFYNFYVGFKCPPQRLAQAFGCLVRLQSENPNLTNPSSEQVSQCWADPSVMPEAGEPQAPASPTPGAYK
jgi:hypothetical protein